MLGQIISMITGLLWGVLLNLLINRLLPKEPVLCSPSHFAAGQQLHATDIPPQTKAQIREECGNWQKNLAGHNLAVEILTALSFLLIYQEWGLSFMAIKGYVFTSFLLVAAFTDLKQGIIPDILNFSGIFAGLFFSLLAGGIGDSILGAGFFAGLLTIIAILSSGGMGGGDVKFAALIGAFSGLQAAFMVFLLSSILGGIGVLPMLVRGKANRKTAIKFGPYLSLAAWLVWMYGDKLLLAYWRLLG